MTTRARKRLRAGLLALALAIVLVIWAGAGYVATTLWASLPRLEGRQLVPGLGQPVTVAVDRIGIPTIEAATRADALRALGYVTARDRLFQMDLLRRRSAGRLAEVFGRELLESDTRQRQYGFGAVAAATLARLPAEQRAAVEAYAEGVNGLMRSSRALPFEFRLLRYQPEPWRAEDSLLVVLGMFDVLGGSEEGERTRTVLGQCVPAAVAGFLAPGGDRYTKALLGQQARHALPIAELRVLAARSAAVAASERGLLARGLLGPRAGEAPVGSNGWAVAGSRTRDGRAILANDMHLELGVPNVWYRAVLRYGGRQLAGLVLPGVPAVIAGSNGHVAWGLTNLEGDVLDLVALELRPGHPDQYRTAEGWKQIAARPETIAVREEPPVTVTVRSTVWGPLAARPLLGRPVAVRWAALDPRAVDLGLLDLDGARSVAEAAAVMNRAGGPATNAILADREGRVAWTLSGRIPRRRGLEGSLSVSWADGQRGWDGYLDPAELPRQVDPPAGFVVNANQRVPLGQGAPALGHDFANGYRAYRITERLRQLNPASEADLFALQLDTRSEFFEVYRAAALGALTDEAVRGRPALAEAQRALAAWDGRAERASRGLAVLARFRRVLAEELFASWLAACRLADPAFEFALADIDTPVQRMLEARPLDLVPPPAKDWDSFIAAALEKAVAQLKRRHGDQAIDQLAWGEVSRVRIAHPLADALPLVGGRLNMREAPLAGCGFCVRLAAGSLGASGRLVVSPGREADGILHMPGGQSGHPLSDHYADQQEAWVEGRPLPLLPGPAVATLTLLPHDTQRRNP